MGYESIAHEAEAEWAIDSKAMRARGIIVLVKSNYSQTSRKRTPPGPRVSVHLQEVSAYGRVRKKVALEGTSCTRTSILKL